MKKTLFLIGSATLLTACATNASNEKTINLDTIENVKTIKLNEGDHVKLEVTANPSTGYDWFTSEPEDCSVKIVDKSNVKNQKEGMVGAPSKNVYTVKAGSKGECTIQFDYKRGWEEVAPANTKQITFIVK
ncbi:protease inhibitor I42 family protein [Empedobacter falsenii]|uniref:protease inhibitor I42 family protein n=1 Tax=Empedobacter falsenii TaxID=343874 RepID=UPI002576F07C|nr:protease inhibitor I42 family protein [Empedobacter falsenii]MDM1546453.1 protease inhibitor I42 family protein [Empedobacter falsenii]